jgi:hypothetical protein
MKSTVSPANVIKRRVLPLAALGLAVMVFAGCDSGNGLNVKTDYDKNVNFAQYHTFTFQRGRIINRLGVQDTNNTLVDGRIRDAVVNQLSAKGLQLNTQSPDLVVTYIAGAKNKQEIESLGPTPYDSPFFGGPFGFRRDAFWGAGYDQFYVHDYTQGTLILDFIDPHTRQLVWRAYVAGPVDEPDAKTINNAVSAALKQYPPKPERE